MRHLILVPVLALAACSGSRQDREIAILKAEIASLKAIPAAATAVTAGPELGQQMLELQIRHARLWQPGAARNWMLAQFELAELRESLAGVVELNGDHAAVQPNRLADVLPAMMDPALKQMQSAIDSHDAPGSTRPTTRFQTRARPATPRPITLSLSSSDRSPPCLTT